jgi:hypothetical protein
MSTICPTIAFDLPTVTLHKSGDDDRVCFADTGRTLGWIYNFGGGYTWHNRMNGKQSVRMSPTLHSALGELVMSTWVP